MRNSPWTRDKAERQLRNARTPRLVAAIIRMLPEGSVPPAEILEVHLTALYVLTRQASGHSRGVASVLLDTILPSYLSVPSLDTDEVVVRHRCREGFANVLRHLPARVAQPTRDRFIDQFVPILKSRHPEDGCWMVAEIGYRRSDVYRILRRLATHAADETRDVALACLVALGVEPRQRKRVAELIGGRLRAPLPLRVVQAARALPDKGYVDALTEGIRHDLADAPLPVAARIGLRALTEVAAFYGDDPAIQDLVWQEVSRLYKDEPQAMATEVLLGGDVAPRCDTPQAVADLIALIGRPLRTTGASPERARELVLARLMDCVRPRQQTGWSMSDDRIALRTLKRDLLQDTGSDSRGTTEEHLRKQAAWKALLRWGREEALSWFVQAVTNETNVYLSAQLIEDAACFVFDPLPGVVRRLLTGSRRGNSHQQDRLWSASVEAVRLAWSAASPDAFDALLSCTVEIDGYALQDTVDALADIALIHARSGQRRLIDRLVRRALSKQSALSRTTAIGALQHLVTAEVLTSTQSKRLCEALPRSDYSAFDRSQMVDLVRLLPRSEVPSDSTATLLDWVVDPSQDVAVRQRGLQALAQWGILLERVDIVESQMPIERTGTSWRLKPGHSLESELLSVFASLYRQAPSLFSDLAAQLLRAEPPLQVAEVTRMLRWAHSLENMPPPTEEVVKSLMTGLRSYSRFMVSSDAFLLAAEVVPDSLAEQNWSDVWTEWVPSARQALADALARGAYSSEETRTAAINHLLKLCCDEEFAIRRSAFRSLWTLAGKVSRALFVGWSCATDARLRLRAGELSMWVVEPHSRLERARQLLVADPEPRVREAVRNALKAQRRRAWAQNHIEHLHLTEYSNGAILNAWRYADALVRSGDDDSLEELQNLLGADLPPHYRQLLIETDKSLTKRWEEVTRKWPEPSDPWDGTTRYGRGFLTERGGPCRPVEYIVWKSKSRRAEPGSRNATLLQVHRHGQVARGDTVTLVTDSGDKLKFHVRDRVEGFPLLDDRHEINYSRKRF